MNRFSAQSGQALLELLFAVAMIMLLVTGFVSSVRVGLRNQAFSRNKSESIRIAEEGLELMHACRDNSSFADIVDNTCENAINGDVVRAGYPTFTLTIDTDTYGGDPANKQTVTSTVSWLESQREATTVLSTVMTNWK